MNYFELYSSYPDRTIAAAWDNQLAKASKTPGLAELLLPRGSELFSRFAARYAELRTLPRSARRSIQRQLARSNHISSLAAAPRSRHARRPLQRKLAWSLAGAALLLALGRDAASANIITVTTDVPRVRSDGECSLVEAIVNANDDAPTHADCPAGNGPDTLVLPANAKLVLRFAYDRSNGPTGLPVISTPITIQGNGAEIVRRSIRKFRLMAVSDSGDLTLQNLTLSRGDLSPRIGITNPYGGALLNLGLLTIESSTISGNKGGAGGGIANLNNGTLSIVSSTLSNNSAKWGGGGVFNSYGSSLSIVDSTLSGNKTSYGGGGGVYNSGTLAIGNSAVSGNDARNGGGGIFNGNHFASVDIENSIISGNHAVVGWGGGIFNYGAVEVFGSMITNNSASRGGGAFNSWSYFSPNTLRMVNSTVSGNEASDDGGGIFNYRGGCFYYCYYGGYLSLVDSTITQNRAGNSGGGLFNEGSLNMTNSVISNNQAPVGPDVYP